MEWQRKDKQAEDGWVKKFALTPKNCDIIEFDEQGNPTEKYDRTVWMETVMFLEHTFPLYGKMHRWTMYITRITYLGLTDEQRVKWTKAMKAIVEQKARK